MVDKLIDELQVIVLPSGEWYLIIMNMDQYDVFLGGHPIGMYLEKIQSIDHSNEIITISVPFNPEKDQSVWPLYEKLGYTKEIDMHSLINAIEQGHLYKVDNRIFSEKYKTWGLDDIWMSCHTLYPKEIPNFIWNYLQKTEWIIDHPEMLHSVFYMLMLDMGLTYFENEL